MEVDLHGKTCYQARIMMNVAFRRATAADYRLRAIHGYVRGSALKDMLLEEYARHPKVLRIEPGLNPGETIFVLREY
jgi:DNA-nicking Smr family endonuclease